MFLVPRMRTAATSSATAVAQRLGVVTLHQSTRQQQQQQQQQHHRRVKFNNDARDHINSRDVTEDDAPVDVHTLKVGQIFSLHRTFTTDDVATFARLSQDFNPIHVDQNAAAAAGLGGGRHGRDGDGPVVHGMLCASLFSGIIGTRFPGAVYATQSLSFRRPVMVGERVTAEVELMKLGGSRATFATRVMRRRVNGDGEEDTREVVLDGSALALLKGAK